MGISVLDWYNKAHSHELFRSDLDFYKNVSEMVKGLHLDVSCGNGHLLRLGQGVGCDFSVESVSRAKRASPGSMFVVCDSQYLPFRTETFDTISCLGSLEHYEDQKLATKELSRVLKTGGRFLISVTNSKRWTRPFRRIMPGLMQPVDKPIDLPRTVRLLANAGLFVTSVVNPHQFDFIQYSKLPSNLAMLLNLFDRVIPIAVSIEPLYAGSKSEEDRRFA